MGGCQSKSSTVNSHGTKKIGREGPAPSSVARTDSSDVTPPGVHSSSDMKKKKYMEKKYASAESVDSKSSRHLRMCEWKEELASTGNLTQAVVRIETDMNRKIETFYEGVHDGQILGQGVAGVVRKVKHRDTGVYFACKCLQLRMIESDAVLDTLREEIFVMCKLDHPNILRLEEVYESETQIFLIQELCGGGDLFNRLEAQPNYHYSEARCAGLVKQMISAVRYLHSKQIVHRDLKLENFLFSSKDSEELKCIDFGLSKHFKEDESIHAAVGTPYTIAPEVLKGTYDAKVDVWSMGVITYLLLSGDPPFGGCDGEPIMNVRKNILLCKYAFEPAATWDQVSDSAKDFVTRLLTADPRQRPSAVEVQQHDWLKEYANKRAEESMPLSSQLVNNLRDFKGYSKLHRMLLEVLSYTIRPEQIHSLREDFEKIDPDGDGEITLDQLKQVSARNAQLSPTGFMSEIEVESIFNSLKVQNSATTIRWHEFIAAGLSKYDFDDRNVKLAFDRLDHERKGYIALSDLCGMLSTSDGKNDAEIRKMWTDGLNEIHSKDEDKIDFEEFKTLLKGKADGLAKRRSKQLSAIAFGSSRSEGSESSLIKF